ncbi:hypothetical protein [uncultured Friedmanniella sp.]|uniref:hypothetical protein n=1 Tax=uncultured Friedmanniella sp. TaxID=335381 RepID=UPI0035CC0051
MLKSFSVSVDPAGALSAGIDVDAWAGLADRGDLQHDLTDLLVAVAVAAQGRSRAVVLLFDEIQFMNSAQLEAIISAWPKTVQRALPITMVGAGLPQTAKLAGDAKSYAERLLDFPVIGNLSAQVTRRAFGSADFFLTPARHEVDPARPAPTEAHCAVTMYSSCVS